MEMKSQPDPDLDGRDAVLFKEAGAGWAQGNQHEEPKRRHT